MFASDPNMQALFRRLAGIPDVEDDRPPSPSSYIISAEGIKNLAKFVGYLFGTAETSGNETTYTFGDPGMSDFATRDFAPIQQALALASGEGGIGDAVDVGLEVLPEGLDTAARLGGKGLGDLLGPMLGAVVFKPSAAPLHVVDPEVGRFFGNFVDDATDETLAFISGIQDPRTKEMVIDQLFSEGGSEGLAGNLGSMGQAAQSLLQAFPDTSKVTPDLIGPRSDLFGREGVLAKFLERALQKFNQ